LTDIYFKLPLQKCNIDVLLYCVVLIFFIQKLLKDMSAYLVVSSQIFG